jgi:putative tricarboxylic transport membrane protein
VSGPGAGRPGPGRSFAGPRIFGAVMLALGIAALVATFAITERGSGISVSGPRFVPLAVSIGLIGLALAFLARTTLAPDEELGRMAAEEAAATHWPTPGLLAALFVAYVLLLEPLGFVLATVLFVPLGARLMGSRAPVRDTLVGALIGVGMYVAFTEYLGVPLPAGVGPL